MLTAAKMLALLMSLGMDTLFVSMSLGVLPIKGKWKIALVFASAEALMPLLGLAIGQQIGGMIGEWTSLAGGVVLIGVGVWLIFMEDEDEDEKLKRTLAGWTLIVTAFTISIDELAVGFSIGLIGVPVLAAIALIAVQAFVFTFLGLTYGSKLKPLLGEWAEKLAGIVLGLLGLWIAVEALRQML